ncbi:MAG: zf-HC2 domain-containing protein [Terrimesophilobacter sp.]
MTDVYRDWDAAYLFGSLSPADRRDFESHLDECQQCTASVAELAALPGLLSRVSESEIESDGHQAEVPASILPRLVAAARRRRRRVRSLVAGFGIFAAAAVVAATLVLSQPVPVSPGIQADPIGLQQVVASPLHADMRLVEHDWGTSIEMSCRYDQSEKGYGGDTAYGMYVTDVSGVSTQLSTWTARPGTTVEPSGTTRLALSDIRSIEIRAIDTGVVLLAGAP